MAISCTITHGNFPILESYKRRRTGPGQYDTARMVYYDDGTGGFDPDTHLPVGATMFVDDSDIEDLGDGLSKVSLRLIGLLQNGEKRLRRVSAFGQVVSVGPVTVESEDIVGVDTDGDGEPDDTARELVEILRQLITPSGVGDRWNITEPILGVIDTYFTTSLPSTTVNGTALTPPNAPPSPAYIWDGYGDPMRFNHPNGWVLESRDCENVYGTLCLVTDTYAFKQVAQPD